VAYDCDGLNFESREEVDECYLQRGAERLAVLGLVDLLGVIDCICYPLMDILAQGEDF
jgi:hypothetical protein